MHFIFDLPQVYFLEKRKQKLRFWNPSDSRAVVNLDLRLDKTRLNTVWSRLDHFEYIIERHLPHALLMTDINLTLTRP